MGRTERMKTIASHRKMLSLKKLQSVQGAMEQIRKKAAILNEKKIMLATNPTGIGGNLS